ncbi:hypothetical protein ANCCAN_08498, partial [Ancylostoma caninum]
VRDLQLSPFQPTTISPTTTSKVATDKAFILAIFYCVLVKVFLL